MKIRHLQRLLPQVSKDVLNGSEFPPRWSHAGPCQLCASPFCLSVDGNNRDNYTPVDCVVYIQSGTVLQQCSWFRWLIVNLSPPVPPTHKIQLNYFIWPHLKGDKGPQDSHGSTEGLIIQHSQFILKLSGIISCLATERSGYFDLFSNKEVLKILTVLIATSSPVFTDFAR